MHPRHVRSPQTAALALVALVLLGTAQERSLGVISDEQQLLGSALALAEFGEAGIARGQAIALPRAAGDAMPPYGLGWPLLLAPLMPACRAVEAAMGRGSSQSVLILLPLACVFAASALAGWLASATGAGPTSQALAIAAVGMSSPLWPLGSTLFAEPLLAALLAGAAACAAHAAASDGARALRLAAAAGACAGWCVMTKGLFLVVAPLALAPLWWPERAARRSVRAAAIVGFSVPTAAWLALDIARFGRPLSSYVGQHFSNPPLEGILRLTLGANEGLLPYFPALLAAAPGLWLLARSRRHRPLAVAVGAPSLALLALVSAWWAWDGSAGWGPRLLTPCIPLLAAAAAFAATTRRRLAGLALLVLSGLPVNLLGVLVPDPSMALVVDSTGSVLVPEHETWRFPDGLRRAPPDQRRVSRSMVASRDAAFAPIRLHAWLLRVRLTPASPEARIDLLRDTAPWLARHPGLEPRPTGRRGEISGRLLEGAVGDVAWPTWGRSLRLGRGGAEPLGTAWLDALTDQALRALDMQRGDRALRLAHEVLTLDGSAHAAAVYAEALRMTGQLETLDRFVAVLTPEAAGTAEMRLVRALAARDRGDAAAAREHALQTPPLLTVDGARRLASLPLPAWPPGYRDVTAPRAPLR